MEFGILFTSHANEDTEPYPRRDVHARVTREIVRADQLGFDYAWLAEHHFSETNTASCRMCSSMPAISRH